FHSGGVAGDDITQGLPRVEELFEARVPKGEAIMTEIDGTVEVKQEQAETKIVVTSKGTKVQQYATGGGEIVSGIKTGSKVKEDELLFTNIEHEKIMSPYAGEITINGDTMILRGRGKDVREYVIPPSMNIDVKDGDEVRAGQQLTEGHLNVQSVFE